jgi:rhomboid protease GluP
MVRESPATSFLLALWALVFGAMVLYQGELRVGNNVVTDGILPSVGNVFGSQTSAQLYAGQLWRPLSATWIHYSIIHLLGNMWVLYQLGPLIESWYGSGTFVFLCVVIGWLGNLLAGLSKPWIALALGGVAKIPDYPSGGGSGVDCGLIALLAVVGWRSRTRFGDYIRGQMVAFLVYVAIVGLVLPNVDNFGHAGGAIVGALIGFLHRPLLRRGPGRVSRVLGAVGLLVLAGAGYAQYRAARQETGALGRVESRLKADLARGEQAMGKLMVIDHLYRQLALRGHVPGPNFDRVRGRFVGASRAQLAASLRGHVASIESDPMGLDQEPTRAAFRGVVELAHRAERSMPAPGELVLFRKHMAVLATRLAQQIVASRVGLDQIQRAKRRR